MYAIKRTVIYKRETKPTIMYFAGKELGFENYTDKNGAKLYSKKRDALSDLRKLRENCSSASTYEIVSLKKGNANQ